MPMLNQVVFDEATHEYRVEGRKLPSVTGILKEAGLIDDTFMDPSALQRGTFVHQACEYDDVGDLDESTVDAAILPYVQAWRRCKSEMGFKVLEIEKRVYHQPLDYCGTLDRIVELRGRRILIDIKTGSGAAWHQVQTSAYALAMKWEDPLTVLDRAAVYLTAEGGYKFCEHKQRLDFDVWKAAVTLAAWKGIK